MTGIGPGSSARIPSKPRRCYCGGPEEAVYGHEYGKGIHCRETTATRGSAAPPAPNNTRPAPEAEAGDTTPESLARLFHETYERLAPEHGYETRKASAVPWEDVPAANKSLMIAVADEVIKHVTVTLYARIVEQHMAERTAQIEQEVRAKVAEEIAEYAATLASCAEITTLRRAAMIARGEQS